MQPTAVHIVKADASIKLRFVYQSKNAALIYVFYITSIKNPFLSSQYMVAKSPEDRGIIPAHDGLDPRAHGRAVARPDEVGLVQ